MIMQEPGDFSMSTPTSGGIQPVAEPLVRAKGWMKLIGVLSIIYGVLTFWTIVGLLWIWLGVLVFKAANFAQEAYNSGDAYKLQFALDKLRTYFTIQGVFLLITLVIYAVMIVVIGTTGFMSAFSGFNG